MYHLAGEVKIYKSKFESNQAVGNAGTVYVGPYAEVKIYTSIFVNNQALNEGGGAIYVNAYGE
jgi:predicted outer membrane repeat protein